LLPPAEMFLRVKWFYSPHIHNFHLATPLVTDEIS